MPAKGITSNFTKYKEEYDILVSEGNPFNPKTLRHLKEESKIIKCLRDNEIIKDSSYEVRGDLHEFYVKYVSQDNKLPTYSIKEKRAMFIQRYNEIVTKKQAFINFLTGRELKETSDFFKKYEKFYKDGALKKEKVEEATKLYIDAFLQKQNKLVAEKTNIVSGLEKIKEEMERYVNASVDIDELSERLSKLQCALDVVGSQEKYNRN